MANSSKQEDLVLVEKHGHVAVLTLNRVKASNSVNTALSLAMKKALDDVEGDDNIWVSVLRSAHPKIFCAGADLKAMGSGGVALGTENGGFAGIVANHLNKPIIAAVNGVAFGGGFEIVLSCDLVVASKSSRFGLPEVKVGLFAAAGGVFRLPRRIPHALAMEMMLTGEPVTAETLHGFGMINRLVDGGAEDVERVAMELALRIAGNSPLALQASKRVALAQWRDTDEKGFADSNREVANLARTPDFVEGIKAFVQKRKPAWTGRARL